MTSSGVKTSTCTLYCSSLCALAVEDEAARLDFGRQVPTRALTARLGRWRWSEADPLPPIAGIVESADVWRSEVYRTLRQSLSTPRVDIRQLESGVERTVSLQLRATVEAQECIEVTAYCGGRLPAELGCQAFRAGVVRAQLDLPDVVAAVVERGVPVLLFGTGSEVRASVRHVERDVPLCRTRLLRLYVRQPARVPGGETLMCDESNVAILSTHPGTVCAVLPNYVSCDAADLGSVRGAPHVALVGAWWRHWVRGELGEHPTLLLVDTVPAIAGMLALSLPGCPSLAVVTPTTTDDARGQVETAFRRAVPTGQSPAVVDAMVECITHAIPTWVTTESEAWRARRADQEAMIRAREDEARQRAAVKAERQALRESRDEEAAAAKRRRVPAPESKPAPSVASFAPVALAPPVAPAVVAPEAPGPSVAAAPPPVPQAVAVAGPPQVSEAAVGGDVDVPDVEVLRAVRYAGRPDRRFQGPPPSAEAVPAGPAEGAPVGAPPSDFADAGAGVAQAPKPAGRRRVPAKPRAKAEAKARAKKRGAAVAAKDRAPAAPSTPVQELLQQGPLRPEESLAPAAVVPAESVAVARERSPTPVPPPSRESTPEALPAPSPAASVLSESSDFARLMEVEDTDALEVQIQHLLDAGILRPPQGPPPEAAAGRHLPPAPQPSRRSPSPPPALSPREARQSRRDRDRDVPPSRAVAVSETARRIRERIQATRASGARDTRGESARVGYGTYSSRGVHRQESVPAGRPAATTTRPTSRLASPPPARASEERGLYRPLERRVTPEEARRLEDQRRQREALYARERDEREEARRGRGLPPPQEGQAVCE